CSRSRRAPPLRPAGAAAAAGGAPLATQPAPAPSPCPAEAARFSYNSSHRADSAPATRAAAAYTGWSSVGRVGDHMRQPKIVLSLSREEGLFLLSYRQ